MRNIRRFIPAAPILGLLAALALVLGQPWPLRAEGGEWRLVFKTAACVEDPTVRIRDVAVPHGAMSKAQWARLGALELFKSPERGAPPVALEKYRLREAVAAVLGDEAYNCVLPGRLTVQRGGRVMDQTELYRRSVEALTPKARQLGGEAEFKEMTLPEFILLPDDFDRLEVVPPATMRPGRVSFGLKVVALNGRAVRHVAASGFLSLWKTVPCAAGPINRMDRITPEKITFVRRNMAYLSGEVWDGKGGPYRATASVGLHQPLYLDGLEALPVVAKGDKINLVYEGKSLTLTTQAEAMADGTIGRSIPVRNLQTKTQVMATVRDAKTVVVH